MTREIKICLGSSCFLRGAREFVPLIEELAGEKKLDLKVKFKGAHCKSSCAVGPVVEIDGVEYQSMDKDKLKKILCGENIDKKMLEV